MPESIAQGRPAVACIPPSARVGLGNATDVNVVLWLTAVCELSITLAGGGAAFQRALARHAAEHVRPVTATSIPVGDIHAAVSCYLAVSERLGVVLATNRARAPVPILRRGAAVTRVP
jgi:hypothetical protein